MDVLTLILTCSLYPDEHLVRAMVEASSQGNQYFVGDVATLVTFDRTSSLADARTLVTELEKQGGRPVIGLLGLPPSWANRGGKNRGDLFDACTNLKIGTTILADHYQTCMRTHTTKVARSAAGADPARAQRMAPPEAVRLCALRRFGAEIGFDGYAEAVLGYLPKQRVLYSPPGFAAGDAPTSSLFDPACQCEEPTRPARRILPLDNGNGDSPRPRRRSRDTGVALSPSGAPILD